MGGRVLHVLSPGMASLKQRGFTLLELLLVLAIICVTSAIAVPAFSSFYGDFCVKAAAFEIVGMIKEAKQRGIGEPDQKYALCFTVRKDGDKSVEEKVSLVSGRGPDEEWNTGDEPVIRSLKLSDKGGGLSFGYGNYGQLPHLDKPKVEDGVTFNDNHTMICNDYTTGKGGTVYLISSSGAAMAVSANSVDSGYKMYRRSGGKWVRM